VGGAPRRALAAFRLGSILRLERIGLVLSMTMPINTSFSPIPLVIPRLKSAKR
jgi:hypothetical protein